MIQNWVLLKQLTAMQIRQGNISQCSAMFALINTY
jgi:hypothetical protein